MSDTDEGRRNPPGEPGLKRTLRFRDVLMFGVGGI